MCCTRLTGNARPKKSPKIRHLGTIAQLCRAIFEAVLRSTLILFRWALVMSHNAHGSFFLDSRYKTWYCFVTCLCEWKCENLVSSLWILSIFCTFETRTRTPPSCNTEIGTVSLPASSGCVRVCEIGLPETGTLATLCEAQQSQKWQCDGMYDQLVPSICCSM